MGLYLRDGLHGADVGVGPEEDVLQLGLLLVDPLHGEPVGVLLGLLKLLVFKQALWKRRNEMFLRLHHAS